MVKFERRSLCKDLTSSPQHWRVLLGTGGSWFFYDFLYYGTALNQPSIIEDTFGKADDVYSVLWQNLVAASVGIPGVIVAIALLPVMGAKLLQAYGFIVIALVCAAMALVNFVDPLPTDNSSFEAMHDGATTHNPWIQFGVLCALIFALNWGPNVRSNIVPSHQHLLCLYGIWLL